MPLHAKDVDQLAGIASTLLRGKGELPRLYYSSDSVAAIVDEVLRQVRGTLDRHEREGGKAAALDYERLRKDAAAFHRSVREFSHDGILIIAPHSPVSVKVAGEDTAGNAIQKCRRSKGPEGLSGAGH